MCSRQLRRRHRSPPVQPLGVALLERPYHKSAQVHRMALLSSTPRKSTTLLLLLAVALLLDVTASALFEDQVGQLDWHRRLIGVPRSATFLGNRIFVSTEKDVIAALDRQSGELVWRQMLLEGDRLHSVEVNEKFIVAVSTSATRLWATADGGLVWESAFLRPAPSGSASLLADGNVAVLHHNGLSMLNGLDGEKKWSVKFTGNDSWNASVLHVEPGLRSQLYVIGRMSSNDSIVLQYDASTGKEQSRSQIRTAGHDMPTVTGENIFWMESGELFFRPLAKTGQPGAKVPLEGYIPSVRSGARFSSVDGTRDVHVLRSGEEAYLFRSGDAGKPEFLHTFLGSHVFAGADVLPGEMGIAAIGESGSGTITVQITDNSRTKVVTKFDLDIGTTEFGAPVKAFLGPSHHVLLVTADGSFHLVCDLSSRPLWSRHEGLTDIVSAVYVDLPEQKMWSQENDELDELPEQTEHISALTRYVRRVRTHVEHAKNWVASLPSVFNEVMQMIGRGSGSSAASHTEPLYRDTFGFRKLIICASRTGKLYALDSRDNGKIVWTRFLGRETPFLPLQIYTTRAALVKYPPVVDVIGETGKETSIQRLNALTGESFVEASTHKVPSASSLPSAVVKTFKLPVEEPTERTFLLGILDNHLKMRFFPQNKEAEDAFVPFTRQFYFALGDVGSRSLSGYVVNPKVMQSELIWHLELPQGERIVAASHKLSHDKASSLGRVLGDRRVLYKYLNPNLRTYVTYNGATRTLKVYLLDVVKGGILYTIVHHSAGEKNPVHVLQCENWIVYHYWSDGTDKDDVKEKGYVVVVMELFQSNVPDQWVDGQNFSSFTFHKPHVEMRSFMFPYAATAIGVTSTRLGISSRDVLFATPTGQVVGIPRRLLDARRPYPPLTNEQKEEMLVPYDPVLPADPRMIVSYYRDVLGVRSIVSSPALLESTSLVLTYGLDLFHTRLAPSKQFDVLSEDFSKSGLLITMAACTLGILVARPMVHRKKVIALWQ